MLTGRTLKQLEVPRWSILVAIVAGLEPVPHALLHGGAVGEALSLDHRTECSGGLAEVRVDDLGLDGAEPPDDRCIRLAETEYRHRPKL